MKTKITFNHFFFRVVSTLIAMFITNVFLIVIPNNTIPSIFIIVAIVSVNFAYCVTFLTVFKIAKIQEMVEKMKQGTKQETKRFSFIVLKSKEDECCVEELKYYIQDNISKDNIQLNGKRGYKHCSKHYSKIVKLLNESES